MFKNVIYMHSIAVKDNHPNKIDATIGVLLDDDKKLIYSSIFDKTFKSFDGELYNYAPVSGGEEYQNSIRTYFNIPKEYSIVASPGATGALSMLMIAKKQEKNLMLVPSLAWTNYNSMANTFGYDVANYPNRPLVIDPKSFEGYDNVFVIINTPASNPVGSTYTKEELDILISELEKYNNVKIVFDLAYFDFSDNQSFLFDYGKNKKTYYMVSLSKTLSIYGLRLGALVAPGEENYVMFARTIWSSTNNHAIMTFNEIMKDLNALKQESLDKKAVLDKRAHLFIKLLKEKNIPYYDFQEGFFVTLKTNNPDEMISYLLDKHIYTTRTGDAVRIAICALDEKEIEILANAIEAYQITCKSK